MAIVVFFIVFYRKVIWQWITDFVREDYNSNTFHWLTLSKYPDELVISDSKIATNKNNYFISQVGI